MSLSSNSQIAGFITRFLNMGGIFLFCLLLTHSAFAEESAAAGNAATAATGQRFGTIWRISGEVLAGSAAGGNTRSLHEGSAIYVGELIHATANGEAAIKTDDAGVVALRPNAQFIAERFAAEGKKSDNLTLKLLTGSLRVITGWIGRLNRAEHRIVTPTTTIGIRGTDHEPYVLPAELASATQYKEGTYDKVNRGKTTLGEGDQVLEINPGRVGFARASAFEAKGLMTILLPVLLDKVPDFYVPGKFDAELDQYSRKADADSNKALEQKRKAISASAECAPPKIAKNWLRSFDGAVVKRDADTVLALFAPDVAVQATVRNNKGDLTTIKLDREELVQSTIAAVKGLKQYKQRRLTLEAEQATSGSAGTCDRISLRSAVIEQGVQSGKPYRFESTEEYLLELRDGKWLAIKAETTQH
jgi:hypothetical protein